MGDVRRQRPDGTWEPAVPLNGSDSIDWEVSRRERVLPWVVEAFRGEDPKLLFTVESRWRWSLYVRAAAATWWHKRWEARRG